MAYRPAQLRVVTSKENICVKKEPKSPAIWKNGPPAGFVSPIVKQEPLTPKLYDVPLYDAHEVSGSYTNWLLSGAGRPGIADPTTPPPKKVFVKSENDFFSTPADSGYGSAEPDLNNNDGYHPSPGHPVNVESLRIERPLTEAERRGYMLKLNFKSPRGRRVRLKYAIDRLDHALPCCRACKKELVPAKATSTRKGNRVWWNIECPDRAFCSDFDFWVQVEKETPAKRHAANKLILSGHSEFAAIHSQVAEQSQKAAKSSAPVAK